MTTSIKEQVVVNTFERTMTFVVNTLFQLWLLTAKNRGLPSTYLADLREVIERGLWTWLSERKLQKAHFEIYERGEQHRAVERWTVAFSYAADPAAPTREAPVQQLEEAMRRLAALPPDCEYRVVVEAPGGSPVEGWFPTTLREVPGSGTKLGGFGHGELSGDVFYFGGADGDAERA